MHLLSINQLTTYRWSLDEDVYHARRAGFGAIGLWRRKVADFGEAKTEELLVESGLQVSCLGWAGGFTGGDGRSMDESIRDGLAAVGLAQRLAAGCLIVLAGGRNNHIAGHRNRLFRQALDELLMAAEVANVTLAIKPMHVSCAEEWTFQCDLASTIELVEQYRSPHLKIVYDHYHFPRLAESRPLVDALVPHLALVQLSDTRLPQSVEQERCRLGEGMLPVWQTVSVLEQAGYTGNIDVELMGSEIEVCDYQQLLADTYETLAMHVGHAGQDRGQAGALAARTL